MKYYIENERGQMLSSLEHRMEGSCWTHDPRLAWEFEQIPKTEAELGAEFIRNMESKLFFGTERVPEVKTQADEIKRFIHDEGLVPVITQGHSFQSISNNVSEMIPELYRDALTQDMYSIHYGKVVSSIGEYAVRVTQTPDQSIKLKELVDIAKNLGM